MGNTDTKSKKAKHATGAPAALTTTAIIAAARSAAFTDEGPAKACARGREQGDSINR